MAILNSATLTSNIMNSAGEKVGVTNTSNTQRTNKVDTDIIVIKTAIKNWVLPKEEMLVTTTITNNLDVNIEDFHFIDTISKGATFVEGSVKIGQMERPELNPETGFDLEATIGTLGGACDITYKILVDEYPEVDKISITTTFTTTIDGSQYELPSNTADITILNNDVALLKTSSAKAVKSGDELTYTIEITNSGTFENTDLFFKDEIPAEVTFVDGSVKIDDVVQDSLNPTTGFNLSTLAPQGKIKVEFKVIIN